MTSLLKSWMMKLMGMPSCQEIEEFAYDYLEGRLDPRLARKFERHLNGCENCSSFVKTYREVAEPKRLKQEIPLDPDFEARVVEFLRNQQES